MNKKHKRTGNMVLMSKFWQLANIYRVILGLKMVPNCLLQCDMTFLVETDEITDILAMQ